MATCNCSRPDRNCALCHASRTYGTTEVSQRDYILLDESKYYKSIPFSRLLGYIAYLEDKVYGSR